MERAERVLERMEDLNLSPNTITYSALLNGYTTSGDMVKGEEVLKRMLAANVIPNIITYSALLNGYAAKGDMIKGKQVLERSNNIIEATKGCEIGECLEVAREGIVDAAVPVGRGLVLGTV